MAVGWSARAVTVAAISGVAVTRIGTRVAGSDCPWQAKVIAKMSNPTNPSSLCIILYLDSVFTCAVQ